MKQIATAKTTGIWCPTREDILNLNVGSMVPDCFGRMSKVVEIFARSIDETGRAYVCLYTELGPNTKVSSSFKQDTIHRDTNLCRFYNSAEISTIEQQIRKERQ